MDTNQNVDAQFEQMPEDVFNQLMNEEPTNIAPPPVTSQGDTDDKEVVEETKTGKKEGKTTRTKKAKQDEPSDEDEDEEEDKEPERDINADVDEITGETKVNADGKVEKVEEVSADVHSNILKAKFQGLVERGVWKDFEGSEDYEWTDENYGELAIQQAQWTAEDMFNEMLDQSGDYGKAIIDHVRKGGNPEEIINLFKESKRIEGIDISTEDGQQQMVREYYTKTLGWSEAKTTRYINAAIDRKELKDEAEEVKGLIDADIKKQVTETQKEAAQRLEDQKAANEAFAQEMGKAIKSRTDLSEKDQKNLMKSLLVFDQKLPDGRPANKFTLDYMAIRNDPEKFTHLLDFVSNMDKYIERVAKKEKSEAAKKSWEFIKGNGSLKTNTGTSHTKTSTNKQSDLVMDYRKLLKD